jgi:DNA-binding LytR/AlgR family response regulator
MKLPVKTAPGRILLLDPAEIYYIEGEGNHALIRTSRKRRYRDLRSVSAWAKALRSHGFVRIHRSFVVHLDRVREIRLRAGDTNDWEVKLDPPVNVVLPVSRSYYAGLRKVLGEL